MNISKIIGLKVFAIKGEYKSRGKSIEPQYILFDDQKTFIELEKPDYYSYRDSSPSSRELTIFQDENLWKMIEKYNDATIDL